MSAMLDFLGADVAPWVLALAGAVVLLVFLTIAQFFQIAGLRRRLKAIWRNSKDVDLEALLTNQVRVVEDANARVARLEARCAEVERNAQRHIQHVGVVRFNAFADTGSDLSFAIALLDDSRNGVVVSSLYGRDESRVYAKPIVAGASSYFLTTEEKQALDQATEPAK